MGWFELFFCVSEKRFVADEYLNIKETFHCESIKQALSVLKKTSFVETGEITDKGELSFYAKDGAKVSFFYKRVPKVGYSLYSVNLTTSVNLSFKSVYKPLNCSYNLS
jgi:hypothetical protein